MRIGMITSVPLNPPWDQGDKNLAFALTQALPEIKFNVLTARQEPEPTGANIQKLPLFRNRNPSLVQKFVVYWWFIKKSLYSQHDYDVDIYHMNYQPFGFSSNLLKWLPEFKRVPSIHTVPATATSNQLSASYLFADKVIALSEYGRQKLKGLGLMNVFHIPVGIETSMWALSDGHIARSKTSLGVAGNRVILFPGHYSEAYGIDILLKAMPVISRGFPDTQYIFACRMRSAEDWTRENKVKSDVRQMGLENAVLYLHTVDDMKTVISASDMIVMPFKTMRDKIDIPTTLLEAMAGGKPFVISDTSPMNELVHLEGRRVGAENVGFVHKPGDAMGLSDAVMKILSDDKLRSAMGRNGVELVKQRFDISKVAEQYRKQYMELYA